MPNVHIEGNGATLAATNDLTSAVEIRANGVSISNLNLTAPIGGKRYSGLEQQKLYVLHADGVRLNDITVTGSAGAGCSSTAQAILCSTASRCATAAPTVSI